MPSLKRAVRSTAGKGAASDGGAKKVIIKAEAAPEPRGGLADESVRLLEEQAALLEAHLSRLKEQTDLVSSQLGAVRRQLESARGGGAPKANANADVGADADADGVPPQKMAESNARRKGKAPVTKDDPSEDSNPPEKRKKPKRQCRVEGCSRFPRGGGLCIAHGGPPPAPRHCKVEGCGRQERKGGLCFEHGTRPDRPRCSEEGCDNFSRGRSGLCKRHDAPRYCCSEGCAKRARVGNMCNEHAQKAGHGGAKEQALAMKAEAGTKEEGCPPTKENLSPHQGSQGSKKAEEEQQSPIKEKPGVLCTIHDGKDRGFCSQEEGEQQSPKKEEPIPDQVQSEEAQAVATEGTMTKRKLCSAEGCDAIPKGKSGLCARHDAPDGLLHQVQREKAAADATEGTRRKRKLCSVEGCDTISRGKSGLCARHDAPRYCGREGCAKRARERGLCAEHARAEPEADAKKCLWDKRYRELVSFREANGHCRVPGKTPVLGNWVAYQRVEMKKFARGEKSHLTEERVQKLELVGFECNIRKRPDDWDTNFHQLTLFKQIHGHCRVPKREGTLGRWVSRQRERLRELNKGERIATAGDQMRFQRLDGIGFWDDPKQAKEVAHRCNGEGCTNWAVREGVCTTHGVKDPSLCDREGCFRLARAGGVCGEHKDSTWVMC